MIETTGYLRIGELARRTGVTPELLRAWEQRYALLQPTRSEGGFRLYSDRDEMRVRRTTRLIEEGLSAAEAARQALSSDPAPWIASADADVSVVTDLRTQLRKALDIMDGEGAHGVLDRILATLSVDAVLRDVVLPYLRELGDRWEAGEASVAQEHFASNLIRGRLMGIAREWGAGEGRAVVLACPPGEMHDLGLIMFGIEIARLGWRVIFIGADTPLATIESTVRTAQPALVVLAVMDPLSVRSHAGAIRSLSALAPVALGGAVTPEDGRLLGVRVLSGDPMEAARSVARQQGEGTRARAAESL